MRLINLYSQDNVRRIVEAVNKLEFSDGRVSATGHAKTVKSNLQVSEVDPQAFPLLEQIRNNLLTDKNFKLLTYAEKVMNLRFAKYQTGDAYGWHFDGGFMSHTRADLSFTLFLNDDYDGGELELDFGHATAKIKGKPGQVVIYDTGVRHRVNEVTSGTRLCLVGWAKSLVPRPQDRQALQSLYELFDHQGSAIERDALLNDLYQYLCRRLSD